MGFSLAGLEELLWETLNIVFTGVTAAVGVAFAVGTGTDFATGVGLSLNSSLKKERI